MHPNTCERADQSTPTDSGRVVVSDSPERQQQRAENERQAHRSSVAPVTTIVGSLIRLVGAPLTAYLSSVTETRAVRQWETGERSPHPTTQTKLQLALQIAQFLKEEGEGGVIGAWFVGLNPTLDDQSPADLIRLAGGEELSAVGRRVLAAAREFIDT
jgi:hypothetical protein